MASTILDDLLPDRPASKKRRADGPAASAAPHKSARVSAVAQHYNRLPDAGLAARRQSRIFHLRNFNNWVKSVVIGKYVSVLRQSCGMSADDPTLVLCVFDMCCGKGGDALKWRKAGVRHLLCADIAEASLEQCERRHIEMRRGDGPGGRARGRGGWRNAGRPTPMFGSDYMHADCTRDIRKQIRARLTRLRYESVDLTSCQFALHYGFESLAQARAIVRNACDCLRPGGYFIGSLPNADVIVALLRRHGGRYENDIMSISAVDNDNIVGGTPALFGEQFNFRLHEQVDCPEYLVHFPLLVKLASECGMELVWHEAFPDVYEAFADKTNSSERRLLQYMRCLESYPPMEGEQPVAGGAGGDADHAQYECAEERLKQLAAAEEEAGKGKDSRTTVGTLSRSEWEVAGLYLAFAFQKRH